MNDKIEPMFDSIVGTDVVLPYRDEPYRSYTFTDQGYLNGYRVIVIADSVPTTDTGREGEGDRLSTIIARIPRCILSEVNTHRVFSRNSASSRARSIRTVIHDVMNDPYIPLFTKNRKGMSGSFVTYDEFETAKAEWLAARDSAVYHALGLLLGDLRPASLSVHEIADHYESLIDLYYAEVYNSELPNADAPSIHKQDVNRLLEPFSWHEVIITSSYWDNFLELRANLDTAQPAIVAFAKLVEYALADSVPTPTWIHLPFIPAADYPTPGDSFTRMRPVLMRSSTESAQISYYDKSTAARSTATAARGESLLAANHMSPFEHAAIEVQMYAQMVDADQSLPGVDAVTSNLDAAWVQLRPIVSALPAPEVTEES